MRTLLNRKERLQNLVRNNRNTLDKSVTNIEELIQKNRDTGLTGLSSNEPVRSSSATYRTINESPRYQVSRSKINN